MKTVIGFLIGTATIFLTIPHIPMLLQTLVTNRT